MTIAADRILTAMDDVHRLLRPFEMNSTILHCKLGDDLPREMLEHAKAVPSDFRDMPMCYYHPRQVLRPPIPLLEAFALGGLVPAGSACGNCEEGVATSGLPIACGTGAVVMAFCGPCRADWTTYSRSFVWCG